MAEVTKTVITDDFTGEVLEEKDRVAIIFSVNTDKYAIDTTKEGEKKIMGILSELIKVAHPVRSSRQYPRDARAGEIRAWARDNGYDVPSRGRLPFMIVEAYEEAHPNE